MVVPMNDEVAELHARVSSGQLADRSARCRLGAPAANSARRCDRNYPALGDILGYAEDLVVGMGGLVHLEGLRRVELQLEPVAAVAREEHLQTFVPASRLP